MRKEFLLLIGLIGMMLISLSSAGIYEDCEIYGTCVDEQEVTIFNNFTTNNTNASEFWITNLGSLDDVNATQFNNNAGTLNIDESWVDSLWCRLTGCTMSGSITADSFIGNGSTLNFSFTDGSVIFAENMKLAQDNSNFFWDEVNKRLGVGTSSPSEKLTVDVEGAERFTFRDSATGNDIFLFGRSVGNGGFLFGYDLLNNPGFGLRGYDLGGNNGQGFFNKGTIEFSPLPDTGFVRGIRVGGGSTTINSGGYIEFASSSTWGFGGRIGGIRSGAGGANALVFQTGGNSQVERMRIDNNGNIGIGTATPTQKLDVNGSVNVSGGNDLFVTDDLFIADDATMGGDLGVAENTTSNWFNGKFNWTTLDIMLDFDGSALDLNRTEFNNSVNELTASVTYNATSITTIDGTLDAGNLTSVQIINQDSYNVSEDAGANAILIQVNFTGVETFSSILLREQYNGGMGHEITIESWNYDTSSWELHGEITDQASFVESVINILDASDHVSGGLVQIKFEHQQNGVPSHNFFLDYIALQEGFTSITSAEHDGLLGRDNIVNHPWALPTNGSLRNASSIFVTNNVTASYYFGNGSQLTGISGGNSSWNQTHADGLYILQANEGNLNVNSSDFWDDLNTVADILGSLINNNLNWINFSQANNGTFLTSETDPLWTGNQSNYYTKSDVDTNVTSANSSMKTYVDAQDIAVNSTMKTYTDVTFITQANEGNLNVNNSNTTNFLVTSNNGTLTGINVTEFENENGLLNIVASWFSSRFDSLFGAKDTDDLSEGSTNLYDNQTWNQTHADTLYSNDSDTNETSFVNNLTLTNCSGTDKMIGVYTNGSVICDSDANSGGNNNGIMVFDGGDTSLSSSSFWIGFGIACTGTSIDCQRVLVADINVTNIYCDISGNSGSDQAKFAVIENGGYVDINCTTGVGDTDCFTDDLSVVLSRGNLVAVDFLELDGTTGGHGTCSLLYTFI